MRLIIQDDYESMGLWAAAYVLRRIRNHAPTAAKPFLLGLPTGSSPISMYKALIDFHRQGLVSFEHVISFNMDEYVGLPHDHPQSYHAFMWNNFFSHVDVQADNVHIPDGMAADLSVECDSYEAAIRQLGGIDLFIGGIGADGHIAFNEPGSSLNSRTRVKTITSDTRAANSRFFDNNIDDVPETALTVGVGTIMDAREVLLVVNGQSKARALAQAVEQGVNHLCTASCLQLHPHAIIVCDEDAALELRVGTYKYFRNVEAAQLDYRLMLE